MWAAVGSSRLLPTSEDFHELLQDPMVIEKVTESGVIGRLYLLGAMR
jgi:hypothetical protein